MSAAVRVLNPKNPRDGIINNEEIFFGGAGLKFISLSRNTLNDNSQITGIKHCLKVQMVDKKEHNKYGKFSDSNDVILMELKLEHTQGIAGVLYGTKKEYKCAIIRPGKEKKQLHIRKHNKSDSGFSITLSHGGMSFSTGFDSAIGWSLLMVILSVLKSIHPTLNEQTLITTFIRTGGIS